MRAWQCTRFREKMRMIERELTADRRPSSLTRIEILAGAVGSENMEASHRARVHFAVP